MGLAIRLQIICLWGCVEKNKTATHHSQYIIFK
jgi:hypothetical protein